VAEVGILHKAVDEDEADNNMTMNFTKPNR
jgi:hypothetical protein